MEETGSTCTSPTINEEVLQAAVVKAINEILGRKEALIATLQTNIVSVLNKESDKDISGIDAKLEELQNELLRLATAKVSYEEVTDEINQYRELKQRLLVENADREGRRQRIEEMNGFLHKQLSDIKKYDDQLVRRHIIRVTVYDGKLSVNFKSGLCFDINI